MTDRDRTPRNPEGDELRVLEALAAGPLTRLELYAKAGITSYRGRAAIERLLARQRIVSDVLPGTGKESPIVVLRLRS